MWSPLVSGKGLPTLFSRFTSLGNGGLPACQPAWPSRAAAYMLAYMVQRSGCPRLPARRGEAMPARPPTQHNGAAARTRLARGIWSDTMGSISSMRVAAWRGDEKERGLSCSPLSLRD